MESFSKKLSDLFGRAPDGEKTRIVTIDAHTEGEPLRVILGGLPEIPGDTILQRRRYAQEHLDHLRTALMWEPRGHADMYGCILVPPVTAGADFGVLFLHNEGFSTMCGHGIIAVTRVVLEIGLLPITEPETTVRIDTPAGPVTSHARITDGKVTSVRFHNVASYAAALDAEVHVPELGTIRYDLAFGGAYYAFVDAGQVGLKLTPDNFRPLIEKGMQIKRAVMKGRNIEHPFEPDLNFLYGTIFVGPPVSGENHSRNVCIFAEGEVDRSPTGTGVSARLAIHYARREITVGQAIVIESIIGSTFTGRVVEKTTFGPHAAVVPEVEGRAFITGRHQFVLDPDDPFKDGFILR
ncbi:MAG: proline racemase family protein [Candidatus Zixiibacteriota bacterium]|nr:MAG: proline racemase family protein [candidate division Zixibacteria bacterium]